MISFFTESQLYASSYLHSETLVNFAGLFDVNTQLKKSILVIDLKFLSEDMRPTCRVGDLVQRTLWTVILILISIS